MSRQASLWDMGNATSLPGSGDGAGHSGLPDGRMTGPCGPAPVLANLSARQAGDLGLLTSGTYGRGGFISSGSADLQSSLANRLRQRLPLSGLTLFRMTWKQRVTPLGRLICALRASGRRTSGSGCGSWQTPACRDWKDNDGDQYMEKYLGEGMTSYCHLGTQVQLSSWPTPSAQGSAGEISEDLERRGEKWVNTKTGRVLQTNLATDVKMLAISGTPANGSPAGTGSSGQLNPAFSLWLMGYPPEWGNCAPLGTRSARK